jgi:PIN domain nuclease of toxin-antitoxin system
MRLLLDTHIWIWSLVEPSRLSFQVRTEIEDPDNEIWLSPITTWETLILVRKGRLRLAADTDAWLRDAMRRTGAKEASLTHEVSLQTCTLDLGHSDPADLFLAATAVVYGLMLVTADERLLTSRQYATLPNR